MNCLLFSCFIQGFLCNKWQINIGTSLLVVILAVTDKAKLVEDTGKHIIVNITYYK